MNKFWGALVAVFLVPTSSFAKPTLSDAIECRAEFSSIMTVVQAARIPMNIDVQETNFWVSASDKFSRHFRGLSSEDLDGGGDVKSADVQDELDATKEAKKKTYFRVLKDSGYDGLKEMALKTTSECNTLFGL
ncbi:MAG: hypothetical protein AAF641_10615 [Pseudomonadota bacterium]